MQQLSFLFKYLKYYFTAKTKYSIHSPFVYDLLTNTIQNENRYYCYGAIERLRELLLQDHTKIKRTDFGAGSLKNNATKQSISSIAKNAAKPFKYASLIFRLANKFQPKTILELGTSLGISTCYLSFAKQNATIITIEGCPETAAIAAQNFKKIKLQNIEQVIGNFDTVLPNELTKIKKLDFAFIDGNHHEKPTHDYFNQFIPYTHNNTVLIFDDIHWSKGMENAWAEIKNDKRVTLTIDLFFIGIVFFNTNFTKENFIIKY